MPERMKQISGPPATDRIERLAASWCRLMYATLMWPAHGQYQCGSCGWRYPMPCMEPRSPVSEAARHVLFLHRGVGHSQIVPEVSVTSPMK